MSSSRESLPECLTTARPSAFMKRSWHKRPLPDAPACPANGGHRRIASRARADVKSGACGPAGLFSGQGYFNGCQNKNSPCTTIPVSKRGTAWARSRCPKRARNLRDGLTRPRQSPGEAPRAGRWLAMPPRYRSRDYGMLCRTSLGSNPQSRSRALATILRPRIANQARR